MLSTELSLNYSSFGNFAFYEDYPRKVSTYARERTRIHTDTQAYTHTNTHTPKKEKKKKGFSLRRSGNGKNRHFFKELTPRSWTYELRGQGNKKHIPNQRQHTPHTILQKLSPKPWPTPLYLSLPIIIYIGSSHGK